MNGKKTLSVPLDMETHSIIKKASELKKLSMVSFIRMKAYEAAKEVVRKEKGETDGGL